MAVDARQLRADTPGCTTELVHFNNAGASLMPQPVIEAVERHWAEEIMSGGYEAAERRARELQATYEVTARLVGGAADEIAFFDNATRAWQAAFHAIGWSPGDELITGQSEYNSNMIAFRHAEASLGISVLLVPDTLDGIVDVDALESMISSRTRLIAISHMPTNDGLINPAREIGMAARRHKVPFLLDACQSVGQMPIDVKALGCTMLSATGRKYLRGPRGTGFLWVDRSALDALRPHALDIQSARWTEVDRFELAAGAQRFELWERNVAAQLGLGAACRYALEIGLENIWDRVSDLATQMRGMLGELPGITVQDRGLEKSGIVTFFHDSVPAETLVRDLRQRFGINTSLSNTQLTRRALRKQGVKTLVRASVHAYNTADEINRLRKALAVLTAGQENNTKLNAGQIA
ncbi:aminotransferase class V-fold PLP-dependent enzyme [Nitratireductor kimnyeongensis]|uniref:Aminotransferase class V-fold PLP-dependent enzyme n=1 Tax=Nitratireductor kimnyeongensis TaxID=430679 RepID=A0ABW0TBP5_9HYPH|nr:aminotransferase class V-fold PLP-dependent enzyme [Nitratireductor kimnyeongensis]QZZ36951.1 aminotransferase class V-fold PLP-dependent enzyme [Nitratireductor kimnyeongensis]